MSTPATINIARTLGDTYSFGLRVGADLRGYTITMTVDSLESPAEGSVATRLFQATGAIASATRTSSVVRWTLTDDQADIPAGSYFVAFKAVAGAVERTFARGSYVQSSAPGA